VNPTPQTASDPTQLDSISNSVSIVLITYNREPDIRKSLADLRDHVNADTEILVIDNASTDGTPEVLRAFESEMPGLRCIRADRNLGVAGGRNLGIREAKGDILVFLDDDAEFLTKEPLGKITARFQEDPSIGALAFKIVNGAGGVRDNEFPHWNKKLPKDVGFEASYFVGAGHALRKSALQPELYPDTFFFSQEELFLSYLLIESEYRIVYMPEVSVLHWQSGAGRLVNKRKWYLLLRNTLLTNHRFLPSFYAWLSVPVWAAKIFIRCPDFFMVTGAVREFLKMRREPLFASRPFSAEAFARIRRHGGRVWW
jgi:GT2 family glycosyltransferase